MVELDGWVGEVGRRIVVRGGKGRMPNPGLLNVTLLWQLFLLILWICTAFAKED